MSDPSRPDIPKRNPTQNTRRSSSIGAFVGVEIGYNTIYMVRLKKTADEEVVFEKCRSFAYDPSLTPGTSAFVPVIKKALKQICGFSRNLAIWSTPRLDQVRLHHVRIPQVGPTKLPGTVYWALQREESFLEKETVIDFEIEGDATPDTNLNITGALIGREGVENIQQAFSQAGYPLTGLGTSPGALRNLVKLRGDRKEEEPVLVCQVGQRATSVSVLSQGRLVFTRTISLGLHSLTEAIIKDFDPSLSHEQACDLIFKLESAEEDLSAEQRQQNENILNLLRPVLERTARQIERTIQYYQTNFNTEPVETIFLGGEIAARSHLFDLISEQLSPEVIAIDPFETPGLRAKTPLPTDRADRIAFGTAFGLALEAGQPGINLAHTYKERRNESTHRKIAIAACVFLMALTAATAFVYYWQRAQLRSLATEKGNLEQSLAKLGPRLDEAVITRTTAEVQALQKNQRAAAKRYESLAILSEITRLTPEEISLLNISAAMAGPLGTSEEEKETLILKGVVEGERTSLETSLTIYIARLDQSHLFHAVEVDSTELIESSGDLHLTFTLKVKTNDESEGDST